MVAAPISAPTDAKPPDSNEAMSASRNGLGGEVDERHVDTERQPDAGAKRGDASYGDAGRGTTKRGNRQSEAEAKVHREPGRLHRTQRRPLADLGTDRSFGRWRPAMARIRLDRLGLLPRDRRLEGFRPLAHQPVPANRRVRHPARDETNPALADRRSQLVPRRNSSFAP